MKQEELIKAWNEGVLNESGKDDLIEYLLGENKDLTEQFKDVCSKKGLTSLG